MDPVRRLEESQKQIRIVLEDGDLDGRAEDHAEAAKRWVGNAIRAQRRIDEAADGEGDL